MRFTPRSIVPLRAQCVIVSDYATLMVEILKDNARPEAGEVYRAMDMGWAKLVGQIATRMESSQRRTHR